MKKLFFTSWPDNLEQLTLDQAKVISVVKDSQLKWLICVSLLAVFLLIFILLIYFVFTDKYFGIGGFSLIETMLAFSMYKIISHYFPAIKSAIS